MNKGINELIDKIGEITFSDATNSNVKRENANIDGNSAMGTMLQYGSAVSNYYCSEFVMNKKFSDMHNSGDMHVHDKDFYNMGTQTCCQIGLKDLFKGGFSTGHGFLREPQSIASYAALAAIAIQSNQNDQHGGQSVPAFDYDMAPGVIKTYRSKYKENAIKALEMSYLFPAGDDQLYIDTVLEYIPEIESIEIEDRTSIILKIADGIKTATNVDDPSLFEHMIDLAKTVDRFAHKHAYKETDRATFQAMEGIVHNLNTMHSRAGAQVPFSSLNFGTDTSPEGRMVIRNLLSAIEAGLGNGETAIFPIAIFKVKDGVNYEEDSPNHDLFRLAMRVSSKRLFPNFSFLDAPFNIQYYKKGDYRTEVAYMGCRTRVIGNDFDRKNEIVTGRGNLSFSTINLPRLGIKFGKLLNDMVSYDLFFNGLDDMLDNAIDQLLERFNHQCTKKVKNFPFLMGQGIWLGSEKLGPEDSIEEVLRQGTLSVGFIGLAECLKALIGEHHGESANAQELGLKIIGFMREKLDNASKVHNLNFSLLGTPAEGLSGKFTIRDRKMFGEIPGVTDREYYTNSFHVPVYHNISAFDKIDIEAPYHNLCNAGHISYVEFDGAASKNLEAFEAVICHMHDAGIGYGSVNHPVDRCPVCGYNGIIGDFCPSCGVTEESGNFERTRRITGYLVGGLERWNDGKFAELRDRVKHTIDLTKMKKFLEPKIRGQRAQVIVYDEESYNEGNTISE